MVQPPRKITNVVIAGHWEPRPTNGETSPQKSFQSRRPHTRPIHSETAPSVEAIEANYTSVKSLSKSIVVRGLEATVIILSRRARQASLMTMQAAVDAGMYRAIPSYFGNPLDNPKIARMPLMAAKLPIINEVVAKAARGEITYTGINTGMFLDMALDKDSFVCLSGNDKTRIYDGGDVLISATTHDDIGRAIATVLMNPDQTVNKVCNIYSAVITQNQMLEFSRQAAPGAEFYAEPVDTEELEDAAWERYRAGQMDPLLMHDFALRAGFGLGNGYFEKTDNALLSIEQWSDEKLLEEVVTHLAGHCVML